MQDYTILAQIKIQGIPSDVAIGDSFPSPGCEQSTARTTTTKEWNRITQL